MQNSFFTTFNVTNMDKIGKAWPFWPSLPETVFQYLNILILEVRNYYLLFTSVLYFNCLGALALTNCFISWGVAEVRSQIPERKDQPNTEG